MIGRHTGHAASGAAQSHAWDTSQALGRRSGQIIAPELRAVHSEHASGNENGAHWTLERISGALGAKRIPKRTDPRA